MEKKEAGWMQYYVSTPNSPDSVAGLQKNSFESFVDLVENLAITDTTGMEDFVFRKVLQTY